MRRTELEQADLGDVLAEVVESAKELSRVEIALARQDAARDVAAFRHSAVLASLALLASSVAIALSCAALAMYVGSALLAAAIGAGAGVCGALLAAWAHHSMPSTVLLRTRLRAEHALRAVKEEL